jgi:hypothetical protein
MGTEYWLENYMGWEWSPRGNSNVYDAIGEYTNRFIQPNQLNLHHLHQKNILLTC